MKPENIFHWHPAARLFSGTQEIARPPAPVGDSFQPIVTSDTYVALNGLGAILGTGSAFCISDVELPTGITAKPKSFLTQTGGTSGTPKVIRRTQASWIASFHVNAQLFDLTPDDRVAVLGRLSHSLSVYGTLEGLHLGLDVSVLADMRPDKQRTALDTSKATILYATPTQLRLLAKGNIRPLEHIRLILCGGGQLDQNTAKSISALCPNAQVRVFYGAAETSFITLSDADTPLGSVGRAYPHVCIEMRGELGEIWVKSPYLFDGYGTTQPGILHDKDGFISIGELGKIDEDGTLSLLGRKTRVVTIADQNVHLESIEQTLNAHPAVDICAVLARPHAQKGHTLTAIIEGPPDAVLADQLQRHCRTTLNALVTPKTVLFIDTLPVLASGKTDLIALTKWLEQHP